MTVIHEYLFYQEKYEKKYGKDKTVVLYMCGSFYEAYGTTTRGPNLTNVSALLNLILTRKDKKIDVVDEKNPYLIGFPANSLPKYLRILINNGYTVIVVDQVTPPPNPKRKITGIYSYGTFLGETLNPDSNYIACLYIEEETQLNGSLLMSIGMSCVDLTTGEINIYDAFSNNGDEKYALDEAVRFLINYNPKEIIIYRQNNKKNNAKSMDKNELLLYLEIENKTYYYHEQVNKNYIKISYQNEFLGKIYTETGMLKPIEYLDLEKNPQILISLLALLDFSYQHDENIIKNLHKPNFFQNSKHLVLGNNAIYQLNVLETNSIEQTNAKYKCLFDVLNNTSTALGRRYLKNILSMPKVDPTEIQYSYDCIQEFLKDDLYLAVENKLRNIIDIERMNRKISLNIIHPFEFAGLIESYNSANEIIKIMAGNAIMKKKLPDKSVLKKLENFLKETDETFISDELKKQNLNEINTSFFKKGKFKDIDELQNKFKNSMSFMEEICAKLSALIEDNSKFKKHQNDAKIRLMKNDREGYYLSLTKLRAKNLKSKLDKLTTLKINDSYDLDIKKIQFKELREGNTKIFIDDLSSHSDNTVAIKSDLSNLIIKDYLTTISNYHKKYDDTLIKIANFICFIDFVKSNAKSAKLYNYTKPKLVVKSKKELTNGYIKCEQLRHPIIERIRTEYEYIPHDISLGKTINGDDDYLSGMMLYGINSAGKSSIMKAVGLSVIMAQAGMYVPAKTFEYSPYESLFARITGHDNIFKGLSSFALEMTELRAILKRAGPKTLVIGDEVCRGTEHISGNAIVATSIIRLAQTGCCFIFATHLHELVNMERIKALKNVQAFHVTVGYDQEKDMLIFDRKLKSGSGDSVYGLTIAKYIIHDNEFMEMAQSIKNELLNMPNTILNDKKSNYNAEVYMHECAICEKKIQNKNNLDTHHINFQENFNKDGFMENKTLKKNNKSNLVVICQDCHHKIHDQKDIILDGYLDTSKGRKLAVKKK